MFLSHGSNMWARNQIVDIAVQLKNYVLDWLNQIITVFLITFKHLCCLFLQSNKKKKEKRSITCFWKPKAFDIELSVNYSTKCFYWSSFCYFPPPFSPLVYGFSLYFLQSWCTCLLASNRTQLEKEVWWCVFTYCLLAPSSDRI